MVQIMAEKKKDIYNADEGHLSEEVDDYLKGKYFDVAGPGSYSGLEKIWFTVRDDPLKPASLNKRKVKQWLERQEVYQVHTKPKEKYTTEAIIVSEPDSQWDCDILVLPDKPKKNRNFKFLLGVIDLFSRHAWVRLLKTKTALDTANAFRSVLREGRKCKLLRHDEGGEFRGVHFRQMLKEEGIPNIIAYGAVKSNYIERFFRTFQKKYYRYAYHNTTEKFVDIVQDIVKSYNNSVHSSTKIKPAEVGVHNTLELYDRVYTPILQRRAQERAEPVFSIGQLVRISLFKDKFKRGYTQDWSEEVFEVWSVVKSHPVRYKIRDLLGEKISGSFYSENLKLANARHASEVNWKIERIISSRKKKGRQGRESLVKWFGWNSKFASYIDNSDLKKFPKIN